MKKKGVAPLVLESYPDAKSILKDNLYYIYSGKTELGKSKSKRGAWKAAYNNLK